MVVKTVISHFDNRYYSCFPKEKQYVLRARSYPQKAQVLVVSQPPPFWPFVVFLLSDWWEACATSAAGGGGAPHTAAEVAQAGASERQKKQ